MTQSSRYLDLEGEDRGATARDDNMTRLNAKCLEEKITKLATDLEKKLTKMALALLFDKVKEETKRRQVQGVAMITLMAGSKIVINNVRGVKYLHVLFHSGEQLLLILEGKGRKGMMVGAEWLARLEREEGLQSQMLEPTDQNPGAMILAQRGLASLVAAVFCLPLQCPMEGKPR